MKPVKQTETELGRGNCLAACVASLLEIGLECVPNFRLAGDQWAALQQWLSSRGLFAVQVPFEALRPTPVAYCIVVGDSPRNNVLHAVVGVIDGMSLLMAHDPHPDNAGLSGDPKAVVFLAALKPEKL